MQTSASLPALRRRSATAGLGRNRLVLGAAALAVIAAVAAWQWSWLIAVGVAPVLLSIAPCAAMCGLGLCMHRMGSGSCRSASTEPPRDPEQIGGFSDQTVNQGDVT
jgi:hypothetical protein